MKQPYATRKDNYDSAGGYYPHYEDNRNYSKPVLLIATIILILVFLFVGKVIKVKADSILTENQTGITYSACTNPGQFYGLNQIEVEKYRNIYLGYCTPRGDDTITPRKVKDSDEESTSIAITVENTPPVIEHQEESPSNDTPSDNVPPADNEDDSKKDKHPNNGGGNGQELDEDGNDLDPNDNAHANDND